MSSWQWTRRAWLACFARVHKFVGFASGRHGSVGVCLLAQVAATCRQIYDGAAAGCWQLRLFVPFWRERSAMHSAICWHRTTTSFLCTSSLFPSMRPLAISASVCYTHQPRCHKSDIQSGRGCPRSADYSLISVLRRPAWHAWAWQTTIRMRGCGLLLVFALLQGLRGFCARGEGACALAGVQGRRRAHAWGCRGVCVGIRPLDLVCCARRWWTVDGQD